MAKPTQRDADKAEALLIQRKGLAYFVPKAWPLVEPGSRFINNWTVGAVCETLDAVRMGQIRNVAICIPPGCMKSLLVEVLWPVHLWICDPGQRVISVSFDAALTLRDAKKSLNLMQSDWFADRFGDRIHIAEDVAAGDYANAEGGFRFSTSIGGKLTGRHCDKMIVDDPIKPQTISKATLEEAERWWTTTRPTRFRDQTKGATVLIMQRLHQADPAGIAIKDGYEVRRYPMRFEPREASYGDPRTTDGELLWPERFPEVEVKRLEKDLGSRGAAAQLQQRPVPEGGAIFQRSWFKHWTHTLPMAVPDGATSAALPVRALPPKFDQIIQSWDCAFKDTDASDYVVGQVWGRRAADFFLLDQFRDRADFGRTLDEIRKMTRKWPGAVAKLVEDKANGSAVISTLKREIPGIVPITPEGGKEARANAVAPLFEAGNVWHPDPGVFPWVDEHRDELVGFPVAAHDDSVDACTQALLWLYLKNSNLPQAMETVQAQGGLEGWFG